MNIYLDANVYNRIFDDPFLKYIQIEYSFIKAVLKMILDKGYTILCSYVLNKEIDDISTTNIRECIKNFISAASDYIHWNPSIERLAMELDDRTKISTMECLHLACAAYRECEYFVTCNDKLILEMDENNESLRKLIGDVCIISPMNLIREKCNSIILNEVFEDYYGDIDIPGLNQDYTLKGRDYLKIREEMYYNVSIQQLLIDSKAHWEKSFEHILIDTIHYNKKLFIPRSAITDDTKRKKGNRHAKHM